MTDDDPRRAFSASTVAGPRIARDAEDHIADVRRPGIRVEDHTAAPTPTATILVNDAVEALAITLGGDPSAVSFSLTPHEVDPGRTVLRVEVSFDTAQLNAFVEALKGQRR